MVMLGCNPEQQMMYAGSMTSLVNEVGLSKVLVSAYIDDYCICDVMRIMINQFDAV